MIKTKWNDSRDYIQVETETESREQYTSELIAIMLNALETFTSDDLCRFLAIAVDRKENGAAGSAGDPGKNIN